MKPIFLFFILGLVISCSGKKVEDIYQGNLEDLIVEEFIFEKDSSTKRISLEKIISFQGKEVFVSREDQGYSLFNVESGKKEFSFKIPNEGPLSLKGNGIAFQVFDGNEFVAVSSQGNVKQYIDGELVKELDLDWTEYQSRMIFQMSDFSDNFLKIGSDRYQLINNPFDIFDEKKNVDLNYKKWLVEFDLDDGWICASDFSAPLGEEFSNSTSASSISSVYNSLEDEFYLIFAPSDTLFQIKNCQVVEKFPLQSKTELKYSPGLFEQNGKKKTWRNNPESASNSGLLFDSVNQLYIRKVLVKSEETQPEITDTRKRRGLNKNTYLFMVYDLDWNLKAELKTIYEPGQILSQVVSPQGGILVSKPEQASEDKYEFYKIDLSRFQ